jgi:hypothetical protein
VSGVRRAGAGVVSPRSEEEERVDSTRAWRRLRVLMPMPKGMESWKRARAPLDLLTYADERTCVGGYQYVSPLAHGRRWSDRTAAARAPRLQGHIRA